MKPYISHVRVLVLHTRTKVYTCFCTPNQSLHQFSVRPTKVYTSFLYVQPKITPLSPEPTKFTPVFSTAIHFPTRFTTDEPRSKFILYNPTTFSRNSPVFTKLDYNQPPLHHAFLHRTTFPTCIVCISMALKRRGGRDGEGEMMRGDRRGEMGHCGRGGGEDGEGEGGGPRQLISHSVMSPMDAPSGAIGATQWGDPRRLARRLRHRESCRSTMRLTTVAWAELADTRQWSPNIRSSCARATSSKILC